MSSKNNLNVSGSSMAPNTLKWINKNYWTTFISKNHENNSTERESDVTSCLLPSIQNRWSNFQSQPIIPQKKLVQIKDTFLTRAICHPDATWMLPWRYLGATLALPQRYLGATSALTWHYLVLDATSTLPQRSLSVTSVLPKRYLGATWTLPRCYLDSTSILPQSYLNLLFFISDSHLLILPNFFFQGINIPFL